MLDRSSLTFEVRSATRAKLERLAGHTHLTRDTIAAQALDDYLDRELAIVDAIEHGRAEIEAGQGLATETVFRDVDAAIAEVETSLAKR